MPYLLPRVIRVAAFYIAASWVAIEAAGGWEARTTEVHGPDFEVVLDHAAFGGDLLLELGHRRPVGLRRLQQQIRLRQIALLGLGRALEQMRLLAAGPARRR